MLIELLAALPVGMAEALTSFGLGAVLERIRADDDLDQRLVQDLEKIAEGITPERSISEIASGVAPVLQVMISESRNTSIITQHGSHGASQFAVTEVGGDLYVGNPPKPPRR